MRTNAIHVLLGLAACLLCCPDVGHTAKLDSLVNLLLAVDDPDVQLDVLKGMETALKGRKDVSAPGNWQQAYQKLRTSPKVEVRDFAMRLALAFRDPQVIEELRTRFIDRGQPAQQRINALNLLLQNNVSGLGEPLQKLVDDPVLRSIAIRGLAAYQLESTPPLLVERYPQLTESDRQRVLGTLVSSVGFANALLDAMQRGLIPSRDLTAFAARQIQSFQDPDLTARLRKTWGAIRPTSQNKREEIAQYKAQLTVEKLKQANPKHGRQLFAKNCANCHRLFDDGKKVGPELTGAQRRSVDYLLENLIDPNALVGRDFQMSVIVLKSGRFITGLILRQDRNKLVVQTPMEQVIVPTVDIAEVRRQKISLMPEGLLQKMPAEDMQDLIAYLMSERQVPLPNSP